MEYKGELASYEMKLRLVHTLSDCNSTMFQHQYTVTCHSGLCEYIVDGYNAKIPIIFTIPALTGIQFSFQFVLEIQVQIISKCNL